MDEATAKRYREILRESLQGVATDVPELVNHLGAKHDDILVLSDLNGDYIQSGVSLDQRGLALQSLGVAFRLSQQALSNLEDGVDTEWVLLCAMECQRLVKRTAGWCLGIELGNARTAISLRSKKAKKAADALHSKPGGTRDKQKEIRDAWQSGKYSSRDVCAEQECAHLGMSFSAARKALRNVPMTT